MELEELRKALEELKSQQGPCFSQDHRDMDDLDSLNRHIQWMKDGTSNSTHRARYALLGFRAAQTEIDDLKGMMARLADSLQWALHKDTWYQGVEKEAEEALQEALGFIAQAEAMLKGGE